MDRRSDTLISAMQWLCVAAVVHYMSYQGAEKVADVGLGKSELRQFAAAVRGAVHPPDDAMEVTFVDPMAPDQAATVAPTSTEAPKPPPPVAKKEPPKEEKKPEEKKPEEKKPEPKKLALLKPEKADEPKPPPDIDRRVSVRQHVEDKNQKDNPTAKLLADQANTVKEETQAKITARGQDTSKPSLDANAAGPVKEPGNAEKTSVADSENKAGNDKMPPGEKDPVKHDPLPKAARAPEPPRPAEQRPAPPSAPKAGDNGRNGPKEPARPSPVAPPAPTADARPPAAAPDTQNDNKGNYVVNPFRSGSDAKADGSATPAPSAAAPIYVIPKLGGAPGPKGVSFNLTSGAAIAAIGAETIRRDRELDGQRRKSAHRGSWKSQGFDKWRPAIENYVASVKVGNATSLNTAFAPFASYLQIMHEAVHPLFAESFLDSLDDLPASNPLSNLKLVTSLEIVLDGERGRIVKMGITRTSGVTAFDVAALDAMERASGGSGRGFGKPPSAILSPDGNVYLHWEFHRHRNVACSNQNAKPYILKGAPKTPGTEKPAPQPPDVPRERGKAGKAPAQGQSG